MKRLISNGILASLLLADVCAEANAHEEKAASPPTPVAETSSHLAEVDPSNGIDSNEAVVIADAYFEQEYGNCGGLSGVKREGRTWVFGLDFGITGERIKGTIKVDAKTGGVWSTEGPRYRNFESFLRLTVAAAARPNRHWEDAIRPRQ